MSGLDYDGHSIRKGAADSVRRWVEENGGTVPVELMDEVDAIAGLGRHAARRGEPRTVPRRRRSA